MKYWWNYNTNKKVLLRERKRHTARRVAIAISGYSGGGSSLDKNFFSEHVSSQIWCQKFFPFLGGVGRPLTKFFFPVWTCIKPNLVSKNFPFTGGGGAALDENFFSSLNMYQAKSGVKNFSLYWGGQPSRKIFFLVWTCIKPNLVLKIFPFTGGGGGTGWPLTKIFFPVWTCIKPNLVSKIFPFTGGEGSLDKNFFSSLNMYQAKSGVKKFSLYWDRVPPPPPNRHTPVKT